MNKNIVNIIRTNTKGTTMVSVDTATTPKMLKTGNPFLGSEVVKLQSMNGVMGFDYEKSVNKLATKEGKETREAKPRTWGTLTSDRLFVEHKGETYLRMKVEKVKNVRYMVDGVEVEFSQIAPFLPSRSKSSTQADLVGEVKERDIKLENVKELRFKGMKVS